MKSLLFGLCFCSVASAWADVPAQTTAAAPAIASAAPVPAASTTTPVATVPAASVAAPVQAPTTVATASTASASVAAKAITCEDVKAFEDKMHAAVDAALKYPADLKFEPVAGVTIVTYDYQDGRTLNPHITQWSGDGRLDRSALKAVKNADFASITPGIGHKHIHDAVIIVFDNSANIDKNEAQRPQKKDPAAGQCGS